MEQLESLGKENRESRTQSEFWVLHQVGKQSISITAMLVEKSEDSKSCYMQTISAKIGLPSALLELARNRKFW